MRIREIWWRPPSVRAVLLGGAMIVIAARTAAAAHFGDWRDVQNAALMAGSSSSVNTDANDGCPILDPYDNSLYMASARGGDLDIWIAPWTGNGWGQPVNAGPMINTSAPEFCPDPARGNRLFFVRRLSPTNTDIFVSKRLPNGGFQTPEPLNRGDSAINSSAEEWSPSWFEAGGHEYLYFSSTREGRQRIYYSVDGGPAQLAPGAVNTSDSTIQDARPNVRHDGLEIVWDSTRYGTLGGPDIWTATRSSVDAPWSNARHFDAPINSPAPDSRATISWDGTRLMFGSGRSGGGDIYTATRTKNGH